MSVHKKNGTWVARWRDDHGTQRSKSFPTKTAAVAYDKALKQAVRQTRESTMLRNAMQDARSLSAARLREAARGLRAIANADWDEVRQVDLEMMRMQNRIADALDKRAEAIEKDGAAVDDYVGPERKPPARVLTDENAEGQAAFMVAAQVPPELGSGQRAIHGGFFATIAEAEAYRREQPDADVLDILVLHNRFPYRNLTPEERESGALDSAHDLSDIERYYEVD
jgi:hypothetical protein